MSTAVVVEVCLFGLATECSLRLPDSDFAIAGEVKAFGLGSSSADLVNYAEEENVGLILEKRCQVKRLESEFDISLV